MHFSMLVRTALAVAAILGLHGTAAAGDRLLATGGVMQVEGAAGGGVVPWAFIAGLGTRDQFGVSAFCTRVEPEDFDLRSCGIALGMFDRVEVSFAQQKFDLGTTVPGFDIEQRIAGLKVRVFGDAVFAENPWLPQLAVGALFKKNQDYDFIPKALGAREDSGVDYYVAATKVWLAGVAGRTTLLNATLRATQANQFGILGFGGDREDGYSLMPEVSGALFLGDHWVAGAEYRAKPDNLSVFKEEDCWDVFVAWIPVKYASLTLAHADLGNIADKPDQKGWYLSLQGSF